MLRHGALLLAATQVANVSNLLFQVVMGRALSPEQFGVLASMLGIVAVLSTPPMEAVRTAMAHFAARLEAEGRVAEIRGLLKRWVGVMTGLAVLALLPALAFNRALAEYFNLETRAPIVLTGVILAGSFYLPLIIGALQGVQAFAWMAISQHSWSLVRFLVGGLLVWRVAAVAECGLAGQVAGVAACAVLGFAGLRAALGPGRTAATTPPAGVVRYFAFSLLILGGFAVLANADMIMVKRFFPPGEAGLFARAATIGRSVVYLSMPIALAMFPKVTSAGDVAAGTRGTLGRAVLFVGLVVAVAVGLISLWPQLPLWILFRDVAPEDSMIQLVRQVTWAMSPLGLVYLVVHFELAQHRFRPAIALIACATGYVLAVVRWHATFQQVVMALAVCSWVAVGWLIATAPRASPGSGRPGEDNRAAEGLRI